MYGTVDDIIARFADNILNPIIWLLVAAGVVWFFWNVVLMIWHSDDMEAIKTGRRNLLWGAVGVAIMVSAIGIINVIKATVENL